MIEKNIHQIWIVFEKKEMNDIFQQSSLAFQTQNPEYNYKLWQENDIDDFLKNEYPQYVDFYNNLRFKIQKVDFMKILLIYHYGGFYFDLDIIPFKILDEIQEVLDVNYLIYNYEGAKLRDDCKFKEKFQYKLIQNDIMACSSKNHFFIDLLNYCIGEYNKKVKMAFYDKCKYRFVFQTFGPKAVNRFFKQNKLKAISGITNAPWIENGFNSWFYSHYTTSWFSCNNQMKKLKVI